MHSEQLLTINQIVQAAILNSPQQKITFAKYMDLVLYHPQVGYYAAGKVEIGKKGDFFTSLSLGADFGELLAEQLVEIWHLLDKPQPFHLLEMGAGEGLLAFDILEYLQKNQPEIVKTVEYIIIEKSPQLIIRQEKKLASLRQKNINISWRNWAQIPENYLTGCCFSNELLDAFPVHQITLQGNQIKEIYLTIKDNKLQETIGEISNPALLEYFKLLNFAFPTSQHDEGYRTEVNLAALDWLTTLSSKLKRGYIITIDYGYSYDRYYHPQRSQGTLQCYYQHRLHNNPYVNLAQQDITTHVNFTALEAQASLCGLVNLGFTKQALFLMALGLGDRLLELSSGRFDLQQILSHRDALHQLIEPTGLGGFGVLIQGKNIEPQASLRGLAALAKE